MANQFSSGSLINNPAYFELPMEKAVVIITAELEIVFCNSAFSSIFNLAKGDNLFRLNPNSEFIALVKGFCEKNVKNLSTDINIHPQQSEISSNYNIHIERINLHAGELILLIIESLDHRHKIETKINALHNALDFGKMPILISDKYKKINYANKYSEEVFLRDIDWIYNKSIPELFKESLSKEEINELLEHLNNQWEWKKLIELKNKNGVQYWEFIISPIFFSELFDSYYIISGTNLTDHIKQAKIIEFSEKRQKLIIENISDLLLIIKASADEYLFENANDNFCKIFQIDKNDLKYTHIKDLLPEYLTSEIMKAASSLANNKSSLYEFNYNHRKTGSEYHCKLTGIVRSDYERLLIITMKDITEEKRYQEQLKKAYLKELQLNKMKSDFLANMSHEIRTPYNGVIGYSEIIDEFVASGDLEALRDYIESMKEVLGRTLNLFSNIIEVSQIESGETEIAMVDLNCVQVLKNVYQKREFDAFKKNLSFKLNLESDELIIEVDWVKLTRVIEVLVDNAIKYTSQGYIKLSARREGGFVQIVLEDTGRGIAQDQIERLLMPFTQEVEGYTRPFEGAGLGLTIADKLTRLMKGEFSIKSEKNVGTEVTLTFPLSYGTKKDVGL